MWIVVVDEAVIAMLDSGNHELVFAACGVLMNLMVDDDKRPLLLRHGGVSKYVSFCSWFSRSSIYPTFSSLLFCNNNHALMAVVTVEDYEALQRS